MIYENYLIHKSVEEDAEQKLKDLECDQEELFEEINPNIKEEITLIKMKIRENEMMFLVEKKAEMENFESQMQELGKEKLLYQDYIDDISKQEEKMKIKLENMNELINIKKELSMQLEMKLQKFNTRIVYIKNKEEGFKKKINQLERKIRKVSAMARMSKNEIKEVITPKKKLSCFKKQGQIKLMTPSSSISLDDTEKKTTQSTPPHKIFKKKSNLNKPASIFDFDGH
uniref:Uncharacterized protein n=1 Tax=Clastoptera arizonana TaxID=38151 RepID=A0A1B6DSZ6_9HEMI